MTDNSPGYHPGAFSGLLDELGICHKYTRPFSSWQNVKFERMNRTLAQEWQYGRARTSAMSRIVGVNNLLAHNS